MLLSGIRARVQIEMNEADNRRASSGVIAIDQKICDKFTEIVAIIPPTHLYEVSGLTISAETFTLPTTSSREYAGDVRIRLRSTGTWLEHVTVEQLDAIRAGNVATSGVPSVFALWEEPDLEVQGRVWVPPRTAEVCDLYRAVIPASLRAFDLDSVSVDLSEFAETALVNMVAADLVAKMNDEDLALRRLNGPQFVASARETARVLLLKEGARRHNLERAGRVQRWVR